VLSAPQLPGLEVSVRELDTRTALHDVSLFAAEVPQGLRLKFECKRVLFEPATIQRMLAHMSKLLEEIAVDLDRQVGRLPIFDATEREQLTSAWTDSRHYPAHKCIHELFEDQVERTPEKIALVFEELEMSYAELTQRSNQLARYLKRMGVGPDVLVGLCIDRSLEMVISILAILKAGGGYLPLDPRYPKDRLGFMLSDARPPIVLAQYELKELFPEYDGQVVAVDADWAEIERESTGNVTGETRPENLAYVIYTSGSTGRPKGCQITHYNVVRLFEATRDWFQFDERGVWPMGTSNTWAASISR
jgi:non-ribosomal peptide synthetase component F